MQENIIRTKKLNLTINQGVKTWRKHLNRYYLLLSLQNYHNRNCVYVFLHLVIKIHAGSQIACAWNRATCQRYSGV